MKPFTDRIIDTLHELNARREQTGRDLMNAANDAERRFLLKKAVRTKMTVEALGELLEKESISV